MIVSIHQPSFFPWAGLLRRIENSDFHIFLDNVQFEKGSFVNRNKFCAEGREPFWLTVPLARNGKTDICDLKFANDSWQAKHMKTLIQTYGKGRRLDEVGRLYHSTGMAVPFAVFAMQTTRFLLKKFKISTPCIKASHIQVEGRKSDLVLNLCKSVGATTYLSGEMGRDYLDLESFAAAGIQVQFADYRPPDEDHKLSGLHLLMKGLKI